jgi:triosephosphate isomerase
MFSFLVLLFLYKIHSNIMTQFTIIGNWKMNWREPEPFVKAICPLDCKERYIGLALPYTMLHHDIHPIRKGAQNVHYKAAGAFTGEISAEMLTQTNCEFVIVGHSERRHGLGEGMFKERVHQAREQGLNVIYCVGESEEEYERGETEKAIKKQLEGIDFTDNMIKVAYEPVWAIGTGKAATPEQANRVHEYIKGLVGVQVSVLYGGSVTADNAQALADQPKIDGFLVGGASLVPSTFAAICSVKL